MGSMKRLYEVCQDSLILVGEIEQDGGPRESLTQLEELLKEIQSDCIRLYQPNK